MPKYSVMFARFPFLRAEDPDVTDWLVTTVLTASKDDRIGEIHRHREDDTPCPMVRNRTFLAAKQNKVDYLCIVDSDMHPDAYLRSNPYRLATDLHAKPFWDTAFDFALQKREQGELCIIAAPYCGPPPTELPYIFHWTNQQSDHPDPDFAIKMFSREEAAHRTGIEEVDALPTGLMLLDVRALDRIEPLDLSSREVLEKHRAGEITTQQAIQALEKGYCYYEWKDKYASQKVSTEDVTLTRNMSINGVRQYVAWNCWAGHWKRKCVGKPKPIYASDVSSRFKETRDLDQHRDEVVAICRNGLALAKEHA